jgi:hypothetical protein
LASPRRRCHNAKAALAFPNDAAPFPMKKSGGRVTYLTSVSVIRRYPLQPAF